MLGAIVSSLDLVRRDVRESLVEKVSIAGTTFIHQRGERRAPSMRHVPAGEAGARIERADRAGAEQEERQRTGIIPVLPVMLDQVAEDLDGGRA